MLHLVRIHPLRLYVFHTKPAIIGDKKAAPPPSPYSLFTLPDLEDQVVCHGSYNKRSRLRLACTQAKLTAEVEELKKKSAARKEAAAAAASELRDVPMDGLAIADSTI